ncbi:TNF receptor-associated factor 6 [Reticulomyxa filosa]|uniref:TNF receptor-associated factor 6 n=1 Tax=Reticulomyxa filosa TaxID=46433 RepID=X6NUD8_RETFI|nr:TNF receptor-associated factor 6 [Reticulomyxa filosa]|eukprot:ETO29905.1 TNF receptor-associated factor 6 [Reticulomyxa filosa]
MAFFIDTPADPSTTEIQSPLTLECYDTKWLTEDKQNSNWKDYECKICNRLSNSAVELRCNQHKPFIVGGQCLKNYLQKNKQKCPVNGHAKCEYSPGGYVRTLIDRLVVCCPLQYEQSQLRQSQNEPLKIMCKFKGEIRELQEHLRQGVCPLSLCKCEYEEFGCREQMFKYQFSEHRQSFQGQHLQLLIRFIRVLQQQNIQLQEDAITKQQLLDLLQKKLEAKEKEFDRYQSEQLVATQVERMIHLLNTFCCCWTGCGSQE